jgi:hypothetical protein
MKNRAYAVALTALVALMAASGASAKCSARHSVAAHAQAAKWVSHSPAAHQFRRAVRF